MAEQILGVEDEARIASLISRNLRLEGYQNPKLLCYFRTLRQCSMLLEYYLLKHQQDCYQDQKIDMHLLNRDKVQQLWKLLMQYLGLNQHEQFVFGNY